MQFKLGCCVLLSVIVLLAVANVQGATTLSPVQAFGALEYPNATDMKLPNYYCVGGLSRNYSIEPCSRNSHTIDVPALAANQFIKHLKLVVQVANDTFYAPYDAFTVSVSGADNNIVTQYSEYDIFYCNAFETTSYEIDVTSTCVEQGQLVWYALELCIDYGELIILTDTFSDLPTCPEVQHFTHDLRWYDNFTTYYPTIDTEFQDLERIYRRNYVFTITEADLDTLAGMRVRLENIRVDGFEPSTASLQDQLYMYVSTSLPPAFAGSFARPSCPKVNYEDSHANDLQYLSSGNSQTDYIEFFVPRCSVSAGEWYVTLMRPNTFTFNSTDPFAYNELANFTYTLSVEIDQLNDIHVEATEISLTLAIQTISYAETLEGFAMPLGRPLDVTKLKIPAVQPGIPNPIPFVFAPPTLWLSGNPIDRYERAAKWYDFAINAASFSEDVKGTLSLTLRGAQWGRRTDSGAWNRVQFQGLKSKFADYGSATVSGYSAVHADFLTAAQQRFYGFDVDDMRSVTLMTSSVDFPLNSLEWYSEERRYSGGEGVHSGLTDARNVTACEYAEYSCVAEPDRLHEANDDSTSSCRLSFKACQIPSLVSADFHFYVGVAPVKAIWAQQQNFGSTVKIGPYGPDDSMQSMSIDSFPSSSEESASVAQREIDEVFNGDTASPSVGNWELAWSLQDMDLRFELQVQWIAEELEASVTFNGADDEREEAFQNVIQIGTEERKHYEIIVNSPELDNSLEIEVFGGFNAQELNVYVNYNAWAGPFDGECGESNIWSCKINPSEAVTDERQSSCIFRLESCDLEAGSYFLAVERVVDIDEIISEGQEIPYTVVARWGTSQVVTEFEVPQNQLVRPGAYNHYMVSVPENNQTIALRVRIADVQNGNVVAYMQKDAPAGECNCFTSEWSCSPTGGEAWCDLVAPYCIQQDGDYYFSVKGGESAWASDLDSRGAPRDGTIGYTFSVFLHVTDWVDWMPTPNSADPAGSAVSIVRSIPSTLDSSGIVKFSDDIWRTDVRYPFWNPETGELRPHAALAFGHGAAAILGSEAHYYYFEYSESDSAASGQSSASLEASLKLINHSTGKPSADTLSMFISPYNIANDMCNCWSCVAEAGSAGYSYCKVVLNDCDFRPVVDSFGVRHTYSGESSELWYLTVRYDQYDAHTSVTMDYHLNLEMVVASDIALTSTSHLTEKLASSQQQNFVYSTSASPSVTGIVVEFYIERDHLDDISFAMTEGVRPDGCADSAAVPIECQEAQWTDGQAAAAYHSCTFQLSGCDLTPNTDFYFTATTGHLFHDGHVTFSVHVTEIPLTTLSVNWPVTGAVTTVNYYTFTTSLPLSHYFVQLDAVRGGQVTTWVTDEIGGLSACGSSAPVLSSRRPLSNEFELEIDACTLTTTTQYYIAVAATSRNDPLLPVHYTLRMYTKSIVVEDWTTWGRDRSVSIDLDRYELHSFRIPVASILSAQPTELAYAATLKIRIFNVTWGTIQYWLNAEEVASPECNRQTGSVTSHDDLDSPLFNPNKFSGETTFGEIPISEVYITINCDLSNIEDLYITLYGVLVAEFERLDCDRVVHANVSAWFEYPLVVPNVRNQLLGCNGSSAFPAPTLNWVHHPYPLTIWSGRPDIMFADPWSNFKVRSLTWSDEYQYFVYPISLVDYASVTLVVRSTALDTTNYLYPSSNWPGFDLYNNYTSSNPIDAPFIAWMTYVATGEIGVSSSGIKGAVSPQCDTMGAPLTCTRRTDGTFGTYSCAQTFGLCGDETQGSTGFVYITVQYNKKLSQYFEVTPYVAVVLDTSLSLTDTFVNSSTFDLPSSDDLNDLLHTDVSSSVWTGFEVHTVGVFETKHVRIPFPADFDTIFPYWSFNITVTPPPGSDWLFSITREPQALSPSTIISTTYFVIPEPYPSCSLTLSTSAIYTSDCCREEAFANGNRDFYVNLAKSFIFDSNEGDVSDCVLSATSDFTITVDIWTVWMNQSQVAHVLPPSGAWHVNQSWFSDYGMTWRDVYQWTPDVAADDVINFRFRNTGTVPIIVSWQKASIALGSPVANGLVCDGEARWTCLSIPSATPELECHWQTTGCFWIDDTWYLTLGYVNTTFDISSPRASYDFDLVLSPVTPLLQDVNVTDPLNNTFTILDSDNLAFGGADLDLYQHFFFPWTNWDDSGPYPTPIFNRYGFNDTAYIHIDIYNITSNTYCNGFEFYVSDLGFAGDSAVPDTGDLIYQDAPGGNCLFDATDRLAGNVSITGTCGVDLVYTWSIPICKLDDTIRGSPNVGVWVAVKNIFDDPISFRIQYRVDDIYPLLINASTTRELVLNGPTLNATATIDLAVPQEASELFYFDYSPSSSTLPTDFVVITLSNITVDGASFTTLRVWPEWLCEESGYSCTPMFEYDSIAEFGDYGCVIEIDPCTFDVDTSQRFFVSVRTEIGNPTIALASERSFFLRGEVRAAQVLSSTLVLGPDVVFAYEADQFVEDHQWHHYHYALDSSAVSSLHALSVTVCATCYRPTELEFNFQSSYWGWYAHYATTSCRQQNHVLSTGNCVTIDLAPCDWLASDVYLSLHTIDNSLFNTNYTRSPIYYEFNLTLTNLEPVVPTIPPGVWFPAPIPEQNDCISPRSQARYLVDGEELGSQYRFQVRALNSPHSLRTVCSRWRQPTLDMFLDDRFDDSHLIYTPPPLPNSVLPFPEDFGPACSDYTDCTVLTLVGTESAPEGIYSTYSSSDIINSCSLENAYIYFTLDGFVTGDEIRILRDPKFIPIVDLVTAPDVPVQFSVQFAPNQWQFWKVLVDPQVAASELWHFSVTAQNIVGADAIQLTLSRGDLDRPSVPSFGCSESTIECLSASAVPCSLEDSWCSADDSNTIVYWVGAISSSSIPANCLTKFDLEFSATATVDLVLSDSCVPTVISVDEDQSVLIQLDIPSIHESIVLFDVRDLEGDIEILVHQGHIPSSDCHLAHSWHIDSSDLYFTSGDSTTPSTFGDFFYHPGHAYAVDDATFAFRDIVPDATSLFKNPIRDFAAETDISRYSPFRFHLPCLEAGLPVYLSVRGLVDSSFTFELRFSAVTPQALVFQSDNSAVVSWTPTVKDLPTSDALPQGYPIPASLLNDLAACTSFPAVWPHVYIATIPSGLRRYSASLSFNLPSQGALFINEGSLAVPFLAASSTQYPALPGLNPYLAESDQYSGCYIYPLGSLGSVLASDSWDYSEICRELATPLDLYFYVVFETHPFERISSDEFPVPFSSASGNFARDVDTLPWLHPQRRQNIAPYTLMVEYSDLPTPLVIDAAPLVIETSSQFVDFVITMPLSPAKPASHLIVKLDNIQGLADGMDLSFKWWLPEDEESCSHDDPGYNLIYATNVINCVYLRISAPAESTVYVRVEIFNSPAVCQNVTFEVLSYFSDYFEAFLAPVDWATFSHPLTLNSQAYGSFVTSYGSVSPIVPPFYFEGHRQTAVVYRFPSPVAGGEAVGLFYARLHDVEGRDGSLTLLDGDLFTIIQTCYSRYNDEAGIFSQNSDTIGLRGECSVYVPNPCKHTTDSLYLAVLSDGQGYAVKGYNSFTFELTVKDSWIDLSSASVDSVLSGSDADFFVTTADGAASWSLRVSEGPAVRVRIRDSPCTEEATWSYQTLWCSIDTVCDIVLPTEAQTSSASSQYYIIVDRFRNYWETDTFYTLASAVDSANSVGNYFGQSGFCSVLNEFASAGTSLAIWDYDSISSKQDEAQALYEGIALSDFFCPPPSATCLHELQIWACTRVIQAADPSTGHSLPPCSSHCFAVVEACGDWIQAAGLSEFDCDNSGYASSACSGLPVIPIAPTPPTPPPVLYNDTITAPAPIFFVSTTSGTTTTSSTTTSSTTTTGGPANFFLVDNVSSASSLSALSIMILSVVLSLSYFIF